MEKKIYSGWFVYILAVISIFVVDDTVLYAKDKIVIGQAISLSGPFAPAVPIAGGNIYTMWVEEVNKNGGIYVKEFGKKLPVELKRYDDKSDTGTMTTLFEKLILEDKVDFVFPPWGTARLFAAAPIANKYKYILIGGPGGALKLRELDLPYFFQVLNCADTQVPVLADIFEEMGVKSIAMLYRGDLHGIEYTEHLVPIFEEKDIKIKINKSFPSDIKDLSPLLKEAKAADVDALCVAAYPAEGMLLTTQAIELGINFNVFYITVTPFSPSLFRDTFGAKTVEAVMGGGAWNSKTSPGAKEFIDKYQQHFNSEPDYWGGLYYWSS
ncbi:MAG: amino acid ABC transporter substrate-binding protein, partial [Desulfobacteraceae bacterium]